MKLHCCKRITKVEKFNVNWPDVVHRNNYNITIYYIFSSEMQEIID